MFHPFKGIVHAARKRYGRITNDQLMQLVYSFISTCGCGPSGELAQVGVQAILELSHYLTSHRVIYVKTEFARRLMDSVMDVPPEQLHIPYDLFEMSFEDDFKIIDDIPAPSSMVLVRPQDTTVNAVKKFLRIMHDMGLEKENAKRRVVGLEELKPEYGDVAAHIKNTYRLYYIVANQDAFCHVALKLDGNEGRSIDEMISTMGLVKDPFAVDLDKREEEISARLTKIAFGIQCYLNTLSPDVKNHKDKCRPSFFIPPNGLIIGKDFHNEVGWHLRKAHWRFLRDERYRRESDGSIKTVWVRSAEINKEAKPGAHVKVDVLPKEGNDA